MDLNKGQEPNWGQYQQLVLDFGKLKEVGAGNERRCFIDPKEPGLLYKLSRPGRSRQTRREIAYFSFLKRRGVPFSHIPEFYGAFRCQEGIGLLQEFLISNELYETWPLSAALYNPEINQRLNLPLRLQQAYLDLKAYFLRYNVLPSDLLPHNLMLRQRRADGKLTLYLIDGFGSHLLIPINNYIRPLGARTIERHCHKFCDSINRTFRGRLELLP